MHILLTNALFMEQMTRIEIITLIGVIVAILMIFKKNG